MSDAALDIAGLRARLAGSRARAHRLHRLHRLLRHCGLVVLCAAALYPLLWMVAASFLPEDEILTAISPIPKSWSLHNYTAGWNAFDVSFTRFYLNSALIAAISVVGNVFASSLAAFAFARLRFPGRGLLFGLMLLTLMIPAHVTLIPQYVLFQNLDWIDSILPLVVPKLLGCDAFFIFLMVQFFRTIPREIEEAARMDGCSPWRIYRRIIMPLSTPVLATAAIFSFIFTWDDFFGPLIYLSSTENFNVPLALRAFAGSDEGSSLGQLFAMATLSVMPVFLVFVFCQRLVISGAAGLGLKR